ncbi:MAG: hypothetical protein IT324_10465 [Anaerolineae bacterium]|nr:hypothetical protein [Anaerolineae bacterium]
MHTLRRTSQKGQGLVEYALILVLVAIVVILILSVAGQKVGDIFCDLVIQLGGTAPDSITACAAPRVTISGVGGTVSGTIQVEAIVKDNKGLGSNITSVKFYVDGTLKNSESTHKYCLGGGDGACDPFHTSSLSNGPHTLRVVATDADGNSGEATVTFTVAN